MADLKPVELEKAEFGFEIFKDQDNLLDATVLNRFIYVLGLNPSLERMKKLGLSTKVGEKRFKFDELLPIYSELKKEVKDQGCCEDFIECLKLYDKDDNGKMLVGELSHSLLSLGEKLTDAQVDDLFDDCLDEEDDEGQIDYVPFLKRMCEREPPLKPQKKK